MARLAARLHWPLETLLDLEHADRRRFLDEAELLASQPEERSSSWTP